MHPEVVTIFGGSGFVGRQVVRELVKAGYSVKIASRTPERALKTKTTAPTGQIALMHCNIRNEMSVRQAIKGSDYVVNLVGILYERGKQTFSAVHAQAAERIAKIAAEEQVKRFVQTSALGIEQAASSKYARSKLQGEKAVLAAFPTATILRPSIIFGPEDNFFNMFSKLGKISPALPLIGGGKTRFQPVYVGDVAKAVVACLKMPDVQGKVYELGGPSVYTFKYLLEYILVHTGRRRFLLYLPFALGKLQATFLELLPKPLLTRDQVTLLKSDNIVSDKTNTLTALGIMPTPIDDIVPEYLEHYRAA